MTDRHHSLSSAAKAFGLEDDKLDVQEHGVISEQYIDYNRQDVALTASLLEVVRAEWDRHPLAMAPDKVMSPAALGKGYLRAMGVVPPGRKFKDISNSIHGASLTAYFGGRTEVRVRRTSVPVVYVDFLSMYPTVNALLGMWRMLIAARLEVQDATTEVKAYLASVTLERCFEKRFWEDLRFLAKIRPHGDILPVRAVYDDSPDNLTIGVNPLTSEIDLWFTGPDLVASILLTGQIPEVVEAVRLVPMGTQEGLVPVKLRGQVTIDPEECDFFVRLIEERQLAKRRPGTSPEERERLQRFLKVAANSSSYGIFAELNPKPADTPQDIEVYGLDGMFPTSTRIPEEPGEFCFPPFAALTTAAARLMLAILERSVADLGGHIAFGDTDSAAIVATTDGRLVPCVGGPEQLSKGDAALKSLRWDEVAAIAERFKTLSPYAPEIVESSILKLEDINFDDAKRQREIFAFAISSKRYAIYRPMGNEIEILEAKEHGLGHLLDPMDQAAKPRDEELSGKASEAKARRWIQEVWVALIREVPGRPLTLPTWADRPAMSRVTINNMPLYKTFAKANDGKPYAESIKPMNFGLSPTLAPFGQPEGTMRQRFHLLGPFERDPSKWLQMSWLDKYSGETYKIGVGRNTPTNMAQVKSYRDVIEMYRVHPEPKSLDAEGKPCDRRSIGLLRRRPVELGALDYVGKESHAVEEVSVGLVHDRLEVQPRFESAGHTLWDLVFVPALRRMSIHHLSKVTGLGTRQIRHIQQRKRGTTPEQQHVLKAEATQWAFGVRNTPGASAEEKEVARRVLSVGKVLDLQTQLPRALRKPSRRRWRRGQS